MAKSSCGKLAIFLPLCLTYTSFPCSWVSGAPSMSQEAVSFQILIGWVCVPGQEEAFLQPAFWSSVGWVNCPRVAAGPPDPEALSSWALYRAARLTGLRALRAGRPLCDPRPACLKGSTESRHPVPWWSSEDGSYLVFPSEVGVIFLNTKAINWWTPTPS